MSIRTSTVEVDTAAVDFLAERPDGTLRLLDLDEARVLEPVVFERLRGAPTARRGRRRGARWTDEQFHGDFGTRFDVVYESGAGTVDGYLTYGLRGQGTTHGPAYRLVFRELIVSTPAAEQALWRYACEVDLVRTVVALNAPPDFAGGWMLRSPRWWRARPMSATSSGPGCSTFPRRSAHGPTPHPGSGPAGPLVLEVHDASRPGGRADGRFAVVGGPDGAEVTAVDTEPDLVLDVAALAPPCGSAGSASRRWRAPDGSTRRPRASPGPTPCSPAPRSRPP